MNAEVGRRRIDLNAIAEAYDYQPLPEGYVPPEKIDLGIDWKNLEEDINKTVLTVANRFDEIDPEGGNETIGIVKLNSDCQLEFKKVFFSGYPEAILMLDLKDSQGKEVAAFDFQQTETGWNISHKKVQDGYGKQGIAFNMLEVLEKFSAAYGGYMGRNQQCVLDTAQLDVSKFFIGRGYEPEDVEGFSQMLDLLEAGSEDFILKTRPSDPSVHSSPQRWYVFKRTDDESDLWINGGLNEKKSAIFRFQKEIKAVSVDEAVELTGLAVEDTLDGGTSQDRL